MGEAVFKLRGIHFSYLEKFPALCGIDLDVKQGEKIAVIGANGSGKSTLLHLLDGLIFPNQGKILAFGKELKESVFEDVDFSRDFRSRVGLVFQNPDVQLFSPTVKEDILFGPLQLGVEKEEVRRRFERLTEILGLEDLINRSPHQLSIGEQRRVSIATTLAVSPQVMLLDEPTAGLDPRTTRQIIDIIIQANLEGKTIITATHDMHIVEEISDTVYVFNQEKKITRSGPTSELLKDTQFLEQNNLLHMHSHRHKGQIHIHPHQHLEHHP